jgi:hypothetical protein
MALRVRIEPVQKSVEATIRADLEPAAQKKAAAAFARAGIDEASATNRRILGRDPPLTITVDGHKNAPLESVNPDGGTIIAEWELVEGLLQWIADELVARSPVISGAYKRGHTLFADGIEVPVGGTIPPSDEYVFINLVPYARRIEVGKTKAGRDFVIQVPNKIYERTQKDARARFGNQASITLSYRSEMGAYTLQHDQPERSFTSGKMRLRPGVRSDRRKGSVVEPPAIVIRHRKD